MSNKLHTVFQNLNSAFSGNWEQAQQHNNRYNLSNNDIIYKTDNKDDYKKNKLELQQNNYLAQKWRRANIDLTVEAFNGLNNVKLMYRDAELMDAFPEIGAALDIVSEESCVISSKGHVVNVYSKSERIKSIIEDLLINRLDIQITAPMIIRAMCKYGNQFMLLNIDKKNGVLGWKQLPVYNVERLENGIRYGYATNNNDEDMSTKFIWTNNSTQNTFRNWQIGHFRLLTDSLYLPYGVSYLNKARRHWRMLSLMEDMMLIYRLERSIERRVYKIFVGAIDDSDVAAYVEDIANSFKRTPIIDPMTGQVDLRKNLLAVDQDIFIPVRDPNAPTPIDTLQAGQNLTAMDDIKFIQNKVLTALRIPKTFLNFEETTGDGKNLALMDVRFTRTINRIQQAFLMELTKIVSIHLYLLGFHDDITNFSLSMNNPSTQAEQLEIENLQKKISTIRDAVTDPGTGIPIMSISRALKEIMKWSEKDIQNNFEEIRLEKAIAAELEKTNQIIKRTHVFDTVDKMYGEPNAEYQDDNEAQQNEANDSFGGAGGGSFAGGDMLGGGLDDMSSDNMDNNQDIDNLEMNNDNNTNGEISGNENEVPISDNTEGNTQEIFKTQKPLLNELKKNKNEIFLERNKIYNKSLLINDDFQDLIKSLNEKLKD